MKEIDWHSRDSQLLMNPATPLAQRTVLESVRSSLGSYEGRLLVLTSGTTAVARGGLPKWVSIEKDAFLAGAEAANRHLESNSSDLWLHVLPEFHVGGAAIRARAYLAGARVERLNLLRGWDPARFAQAASDKTATLASLVPAQLHDLVRLKLKGPDSLRAILVGGGALAPALYASARELGWRVLPTYGMTEASSQVATAELSSLESSEYPKLKVLDHLQARREAEGLLELKGASLFEGYYVRTDDRWDWVDPKVDGWFRTEDLGSVESGFLAIAGRKSDRIKIGGESVDLFRLRQVLDEEKARLGMESDVALFPLADERLENVIELVQAGSAESDELARLIERFNERVYPFERIRSVRKTRKIQRTALGKLKSDQLR